MTTIFQFFASPAVNFLLQTKFYVHTDFEKLEGTLAATQVPFRQTAMNQQQ